MSFQHFAVITVGWKS